MKDWKEKQMKNGAQNGGIRPIDPIVWVFIIGIVGMVSLLLVNKYNKSNDGEYLDSVKPAEVHSVQTNAGVIDSVEASAEEAKNTNEGVIIVDSGASVSFAPAGDGKAVFVSEEQIRSMQKQRR